MSLLRGVDSLEIPRQETTGLAILRLPAVACTNRTPHPYALSMQLFPPACIFMAVDYTVLRTFHVCLAKKIRLSSARHVSSCIASNGRK